MPIKWIIFVNLFVHVDIIIIVINYAKYDKAILILNINLNACLKSHSQVTVIIINFIDGFGLFMIIFGLIQFLYSYWIIMILSHTSIYFSILFYVFPIMLFYQQQSTCISVHISIYCEYNSLYKNIDYLFYHYK